MRSPILCTVVAALTIAAAPPSAASAKTDGDKPSCDAKYFGYLVGRDLSETRNMGNVSYRLLPSGSAPGQADPRRITLTYNSASGRITDVACG